MNSTFDILIVDACLRQLQQLGGIVRDGGRRLFVARGSAEGVDLANHVDLDLILVSVDEGSDLVARLYPDDGVADGPGSPVLVEVDSTDGTGIREPKPGFEGLLDARAESRWLSARIRGYAELGRLRRMAGQRQGRAGDEHLMEQTRQFIVREAELRRGLAGHVHEAALQDLTVAMIRLKLATEYTAETNVESALALAVSAIDRANRSLRVHMADLGPQLLTETGLDPALESIAVQVRARWEIPFHYIREGVHRDLPYITHMLLLQSLWHLIREHAARPGIAACDLFARQFDEMLEVQVDIEREEESPPDGTGGGWESVDLDGLRDRLGLIGAEVYVEADGSVLRASYRVPLRF